MNVGFTSNKNFQGTIVNSSVVAAYEYEHEGGIDIIDASSLAVSANINRPVIFTKYGSIVHCM
jgi:hypothetical protein